MPPWLPPWQMPSSSYPGEAGVQAAILNVARAYLKDNGIQADITNNAALSELNDLPVFDVSEKPHARH